MTNGSEIYQRASDKIWRETAEAAAGSGKTAYRYSKAPWLQGGKAMSALQTLGMKGAGSAKPALDSVTSFVMGVDQTASLGAGKALGDITSPGGDDGDAQARADGKSLRAALGFDEGKPIGERRADMPEFVGGPQTLEEVDDAHPIAKGAGQTLGALAGWGASSMLYDGIAKGGAGLASKAGGGLLARTGAATAAGGVAGAGVQAGQDAVQAGRNVAMGEDPGISLEEVGERAVGAGIPSAGMGAGGQVLSDLAQGGANMIRHGPRFQGRPGRLEKAGTEFGVLSGAKLKPETKALLARAREQDLNPTGILADEIAPRVAKAATDDLTAAYKQSHDEQHAFGQTYEGRLRLPATNLVNRSKEMLDELHGETPKGLAPLQEKGQVNTVKRVFNREIGTVSLKPREGAIELDPEQAAAYLSPSWQRDLRDQVSPPKKKPPGGGGGRNAQGVNVIRPKPRDDAPGVDVPPAPKVPRDMAGLDAKGPQEHTEDYFKSGRKPAVSEPPPPKARKDMSDDEQVRAEYKDRKRAGAAADDSERLKAKNITADKIKGVGAETREAGTVRPGAKAKEGVSLPPEVQRRVDDGTLSTEEQQKAMSRKGEMADAKRIYERLSQRGGDQRKAAREAMQGGGVMGMEPEEFIKLMGSGGLGAGTVRPGAKPETRDAYTGKPGNERPGMKKRPPAEDIRYEAEKNNASAVEADGTVRFGNPLNATGFIGNLEREYGIKATRVDDLTVNVGKALTGAGLGAGAAAATGGDSEDGASAAGAAGLATLLKRKGIDKVYVVPNRRNALEHESVIRGLNVSKSDNPDAVRALKQAARLDREPRGPQWAGILKSHSDIIGARKAVKKLVAPNGDAFNTLAGHGKRTPGELRRVKALRGAAERGGASQELAQIRNLDDLMRLRNQGDVTSGAGGPTKAGMIKRGVDATAIRAFPVLRSLEGPMGPISAGRGGRPAVLLSDEELDDGDLDAEDR